MPNDEEVLYDPGSTTKSKTPGGDGEVIYDPAAAGSSVSSQSGTPPITAPKTSDFIPDSQTLPNLAEGAASGVLNMGKGIVNTVLHPIDAVKGAAKTVGDTYKLAKEGQYIPAIATAAGLAGFDEPRMAQQWSQGQGSRAIGEAAPMAIADAVGAEKAAGRGDLTVNGQTLGQWGKQAATRVVRGPGASGDVTLNPLKIGERELAAKLPRVVPPEEAYEQRAQDLMNRGAEQDKIDAANESRLKDIESARQKELADMERFREQDARARMSRVAPPEAEPEPAIIKGPSQPIRNSPNFDQAAENAYKAGRASRVAPPPPEPIAPRPFAGVTIPERQAVIPKAGAPTPAEEFAARQEAATPKIAPPIPKVGGSQILQMAAPEPQAAIPRAGAPTPLDEFASRQVGAAQKAATMPPTQAAGGIAAPSPAGEIGSNPVERNVQTIMSKAIVSPEEYATAERILGPDARMRPGEGIAKWRSRVTGTLKAARGRTE